ncbi:MAG: helix-turn-helix transcriptional regulator [Deltaproteobacteria bacterium]|nr:helix-turn-helix transcriptional regulator [Deltaproteobacteria bacterium]
MTTRRKQARTPAGAVDALPFLESITGPLTFGRMLESFRLSEELSQVAMARKLRIPRQHLCDVEKGRRQVSAERAAEFARRLGYSEHQFVALALQDQLKNAGLKMKVTVEAA